MISRVAEESRDAPVEKAHEAVTVSEVQRVALAGSRLVGGRAGLTHRVTWAISLRSRPPAFELRGGGEFVLASRAALEGLQQVDSTLTVERILEGLSAAGAAALGVPGPLPDRARLMADELALPLIEVPENISILDAERGVIALVLDRQNELQARASEFYRRLAQLSLEGRGLDAIIHEAAQATGRIVAFEDAFFRLRTVAAPADAGERAAGDDAVLSSVAERGRLAEVVRSQPVNSATPPAALLTASRWGLVRYVAPIVIRDQPRGFVSVCGREDSLTDFDQLATSRAAAICTLELAKEEAVLAAEQRAQRDLVDELLAPSADQDVTRRRAVQAGLDPEGSFAVFVLELALAGTSGGTSARIPTADGTRSASSAPGAHAPQERQLQPLLLGVADAIGRSARRLGHLALTHVDGNQLTAICQVEGPQDAHRDGTSKAVVGTDGSGKEASAVDAGGNEDRLLRRLGDALFAAAAGEAGEVGEMRLYAGCSRVQPRLSALPRAAVEARDALRIGRRLHSRGRLLYYADLGLFRVLYVLRDSPELRTFYEQTLGPLEEYDRRTGQNLVETLEAFFACNGNLSQTALKLHHHRNSLLYRIGRIQEISGLDLEDPEARLSLQLALKARQLLT